MLLLSPFLCSPLSWSVLLSTSSFAMSGSNPFRPRQPASESLPTVPDCFHAFIHRSLGEAHLHPLTFDCLTVRVIVVVTDSTAS
ncbi:hypothetical protein ASPACDRAFT_116971 [Aspergillus aculeatus ATCC 16872]|uniref:Secreted protein n=1 Tax=Aspergillus aculeatus (strain ATCC 16872 / CBS 172.66 / WB 5094) TaxID=690307 RepID=A0A1L9WWQ6_ASPA1|nr:uncharacterized protein ASPACDRAFT_116971 [Aspergillus aculeatus ATCC 16872]OJK00661.1 hypothetical protein ASPACDRAFT_116971 [Aspergillus aculeatus ATCC 16872]